MDNWVDGRVILLGDAAHPTLQYHAQGACMALEDAVCLAHTLEAEGSDFDRTLTAYRDQRVLRTARIQLSSRAIGEHLCHPSGVHAKLRNAIMGSLSANDYYDRLEWLYGRTGITSAAA